MTRRVTLATALALSLLAPAAHAQGTDVGGTVPSYMALSLDEPDGFATFPAGPADHELRVRARVTSSDGGVRLSIADGDVTSGSRLGRMAGGAALDAPLEARVGAAAFQPLDASIDPILAVFREPVANEPATILLRQRIGAGERPRGTYDKTLLITLSSKAPEEEPSMSRSKLALAAAVVAGVAATQVASADSPRSAAAAAQGGLSVTPSIVETTARNGASVSTTVTNTTGGKLRVRVRARPWRQARSGTVAANRARRLSGVGLSATRFTLAPNARRSVTLTLRSTRASLFGALEVVGKPVKKRRGINVAYRLISSVRFNPAASARRYRVRAGSARVSGRTLSLLVRNAGNTVDPIGGSVSVSGAGGGRSGTISPVRILPGNLVALRAASLSGLPRGRYTARITLTQGGQRRAGVTRSFRVRR
jgi:hypothetical protein